MSVERKQASGFPFRPPQVLLGADPGLAIMTGRGFQQFAKVR